MMPIKAQHVSVYLLVVYLVGASVFLYGFFPASFSSDQRTSSTDLPEYIGNVSLFKDINYRSHYSKTIFMVIDALRTDFVQGNAQMKYLTKLQNNKDACLFKLKIHAPTVTLPRIKAITTGTIPNFVDILTNFGSSELKLDSIVHQLWDRGEKMVFAGDDTWTKLFPKIFTRQFENKDSLFVNDFYQGDINITQRLNAELKRSDWKFLILHYLGLDHIGHVEGPHSPRAFAKLSEMDDVVQRIHLEMLEWKEKNPLPALFLITGDHGMRNSGGHGGGSYEETHVPIIVVGSDCIANDPATYQQIDIAATVSVLLGLPIPFSSIGTIIPTMLEELNYHQQLYAFHYNNRRLLDKLLTKLELESVSKLQIYIQFKQAEQLHGEYLVKTANNPIDIKNLHEFKKCKLLYTDSSREVSELLAKYFVNFDYISIGCGLVVCVTTFPAITAKAFSSTSNNLSINCSKRTAVLIGLVAFTAKHLSGCNSNSWSDFLISNSVTLLLTTVITINYSIFKNYANQLGNLKKSDIAELPSIIWMVIFLTVTHSLSLLSSSFIEEEHQTWYFFGITLCGYLAYKTVKIGKNIIGPKGTIVNLDLLKWIGIFLVLVFVRRLNQTGDKWSSLPDIGDWMVLETNRLTNSLFMVLSLCGVIWQCANLNGLLVNVLTCTASALIYYFRSIDGLVFFAGNKTTDSSVVLKFYWINMLEIVCLVYVPLIYKLLSRKCSKKDFKQCLSANVTIFVLISTLLHKPHNVCLNFAIIYMCTLTSEALDTLFTGRTKLILKVFVHLCMGKMFFFFQGNSNSLATIDVNAGYIGLTSFNVIIVGTLLTIHTYSSLIIAYIMLLHNIYDDVLNNTNKNQIPVPEMINYLSCLVATTFTAYLGTVLIFQNHLFVWTVFSPKLIYEFVQLALYIGLMLLTNLFNFKINN